MTSPLDTTIRVVRCSPSNPDASIDLAATTAKSPDALARYIQERDESLLAFRADVAPQRFVLRRLPMAWVADAIDGLLTVSAQRIMAFRASCHAIEGTDLRVLEPGANGPFVATQSGHGVTLAPPEWAQAIADEFGAEVVQEMGAVALSMAKLRRGARGPFGFWGGSALGL